MLNVPICTQGMQRTWWPETGTIIVNGPYFTTSTHGLNPQHMLGNYIFNITTTSPRGQNMCIVLMCFVQWWQWVNPSGAATGLYLGPLLLTWINFNPSMDKCIPMKFLFFEVWDVITYPFPNFNGATVEVWEWIINFTTHFTGHVISYPCWD